MYSTKSVCADTNILANDHYVAMNYDLSDINANSDGIIPAGTIIPANDGTAIGVLLSNVVKEENPNGTVIIHGFIKADKLPVAPETTAKTALKQITFM